MTPDEELKHLGGPNYHPTWDQYVKDYQERLQIIDERTKQAQLNVARRLDMYGYDKMTVDEKIKRYYTMERYSREGLLHEQFATLDDANMRRQEIYIELSFYNPLVKVTWLDILPYLPVPVVVHQAESAYEPYRSESAKFATITHATLFKRQKWDNGIEGVAFHLEGEEPDTVPYRRIRNDLANMTSAFDLPTVARADAERMGITNDYYRTERRGDYRPAARQSVQPIIYK
jgi:hypothetical protein